MADKGGDVTSKFVEAEIERQADGQADDGVEADRTDAFVARALREVNGFENSFCFILSLFFFSLSARLRVFGAWCCSYGRLTVHRIHALSLDDDI